MSNNFAKNKTKVCDRKISRSLMNATKSSSAKIVPKVTKDMQGQSSKSGKQQKHNTKQASGNVEKREDHERELIPLMERSGTFLKDESMFVDKTDNIDNDQ